MPRNHYDIIVIGAGPGGEGASMKAVKAGKRVAVIERHHRVGGGCTHWGTIPSKALRHAVQRTAECNRNPLFGQSHRPSYPDLLKSAESVIDSQSNMWKGFYDRNGIDLYWGNAKFLDEHTLELTHNDGTVTELTSSHFIVATGSRPYHPDDIDFGHPRVFDSDTILSLKYTPQTITIYGAGVIGCEYASIFRGLGVKVELIDTRAQLLAFLDDEIIHALSYHLRENGVMIRHNEEYERVEAAGDHVALHLKSGKIIKSDILLMANGRSGNSDGMGFEDLGIEVNSRGQLAINDDFQTAQPHIYAVGDIIGYPSLASAAYDQGRYAATHLLHGRVEHELVEDIPTGIYTSPEISSVGRTERELTEERVPYEVGYAWFKNLARAQITGNTTGLLKILFHRESLELLGIHCFGDQASEIVHIGQAIMSQKGEGNTLMYFVNTTFNFPTMAEAYRVAAINGLNRIHGS